MARNIKRYYSKIKFFKRKKIDLKVFFMYWLLPVLGIIIPVCIFLIS
ncbi:hypothetical protein J8J04_02050 ['Fragaria x ananassa' phyllody phytoplasma]|uniref:Uncharacterized protein n=1 Tax='Fragaria x ananassa' phyllody phytoplasma TaxID=2358428 RepID=A0ABS5K5K4_9MOLU|nr:hypothetical protein ['Fragaria x ananassa' phyllody phytoplasma]MBS2126465.1 hypothetical protein ['Fragaria x ananassa' phyllody phytoplasma]